MDKYILVDMSDKTRPQYVFVHGNGKLYTFTGIKNRATRFPSEADAVMFARTKVKSLKANTLSVQTIEQTGEEIERSLPAVPAAPAEQPEPQISEPAEPAEYEKCFSVEHYDEAMAKLYEAIRLCPHILRKDFLTEREDYYNSEQLDLLHAIENSSSWKLSAAKVNIIVKRLKQVRHQRRMVKTILEAVMFNKTINTNPKYMFRTDIMSDIISGEKVECLPEYLSETDEQGG